MVDIVFCAGWSPRRSRPNANDRQTGWGPHQGVSSDDACVATKVRLRNGLLWNLAVSWVELNCRIGGNGLHGEGIAAPSHGRACAGVCALLRCALNRCPGHECMQVFTFHRCFWHHRTYLRHNHCRLCTCARVFAVCSFVLGHEGGGVQPVYQNNCRLAWGVNF